MLFNFLAKRSLIKAANVFECELIKQCNQLNGELAESPFKDNPIITFNQKMANTVFVDSHKNEKNRNNEIYKICKKCGIQKGFEIYFRRPLSFIRTGKLLLNIA